ncbi:MAG: EAL domain-containing protein [Betaproteobacteria bacterium]|nr:EAL domain-containing protein [Betaproteobacteria bacterium]
MRRNRSRSPQQAESRADFSARQLRLRYIIALSLIALLTLASQWLIQSTVARHDRDSHVINIAGRQRMLSQQITKTSYYIGGTNDPQLKLAYLNQLRQAVALWEQSHAGLQKGSEQLGLPGQNSAEIVALFRQIQPRHEDMIKAARQILQRPDDPVILESAIRRLSEDESMFLSGMDAIVFRYDAEAEEKVALAERLEIALALVTLLVLFLATRFIFTPAVRRLRQDIQELEDAVAVKEALNSAENRFLSLVQLGSDWYWEQDENFRFVEVSSGVHFRSNISETKPLGKTRWDLDYLDMDEAAWQQHRELLLRHESFRNLEFHRKDDQGELQFISVSGEPIFDETGRFTGYRGVGEDITERKRIEQQIAEEHSKYKALFDNAQDGIFIIGRDGYVDCNQEGARMYGRSASEMVGLTPYDFSPEHQLDGRLSREVGAEKMQAVLSGKAQHFEWRHVRADGSFLDTEIKLSLISYSGKKCALAIVRDISERKRAEEVIWQQANFDNLTTLPNRRMFHDRLGQEIKKANRANQQLALLFIDLDNFKEINDTLGHPVGDLLLIEVARIISQCVRETDTVARLGGDEFTVLLTELDDAKSVERVASSILNKLSEPIRLAQDEILTSASIGITLYPNDARDIDGLIKSADQAMYVSKKLGRKRYSYFTPALQEAAQHRLKLINELRLAVSGDQLRVYFQPIIEMSTGRIFKAEALVRWQHPQRGLVNPVEFIPLAEETGLIFEIGDWVFRESARWLKHWQASHHEKFQISVNKSPVQFYKDTDGDYWLSHLQGIGLSGQGLVVEITEGLLLKTDSPVMDSLLSYRDNGIQVAIDDFGTGYSSLAYLNRFDIDYLKVDRSFISNLATGSSDMALTEAIIVMAHKLGLKVIAEGVETESQRDLLKAIGCDFAQGFLFSRPVPPEEFEKLLLC